MFSFMQVTLCNPIWHASSHSGEAKLLLIAVRLPLPVPFVCCTDIVGRLITVGAGLQTDDQSLCVRQVLPKAAAANLNVQQPLRRSLQELNDLCRAVSHSQSSTPAPDDSVDGEREQE